MQIVEPPGDRTITVVAAHPDDMESWCAGTLALAIDRGSVVRLILVTSGDKGSADPAATCETVAATREQEAEDAARRLGIVSVDFLRHPDGDVEDSRKLRGEQVACIRRLRPDALFTHDPDHPYPSYFSHRDHRVTGRVAIDAAYPLARDRLSFVELEQQGLKPHAVRKLWLFASSSADSFVDIGDAFDRKISARLAHDSQTPDQHALREAWLQRAATIGRPVGLASAEAFTVLQLD
jgi:LmbE family N-acetylglucosaminyl deacetylase